MISRYDAYLDGIALSSISSDILVLDIRYTQPSIQLNTFTVAKRQGARIRSKYLEKSSVTVDFAIRAYNTADRQAICNDIVKWAKNGGILQTSDREWQRLRCVCETFPVITSALKWTDTLRIVFSAYALPYWEELTPVEVSLTGSVASKSAYVPGNIDGALVEVDVTANANVNSLWLAVNNLSLGITGVTIASGQTLKISYDDDMIQSIKVGTTSLLANRTGADDLLANCGEDNSFRLEASGAVTANFKVRGLWL